MDESKIPFSLIPPKEIDPDAINFHSINLEPKSYVEIAEKNRPYIIVSKKEHYKIGDLIHLRPVDRQTIDPSLWNRLARVFRGEEHAFKIYNKYNIYVIICEDHFDDSDYQVLGIRRLS